MNLLLTLISVGVLAWSCLLGLRRLLLLGCVALLVIGCCLGRHLVSFEVGSFTVTLDRLFLLGLIGAYLLARWLGRTDPKPIGMPDLVLAVFVAFLALSAITGDPLDPGPTRTPPWWRLFAGYLMPAALYWIARQSQLTEGGLKTAVSVLVCLAVYLAVTGILEVSEQWWLVFPRYIANPDLGRTFGRARGPMLQPVGFGLYVTVGLLAVSLWQSRFGRLARYLAVASLPLFLAAVYFTYTRSVWLGTTLGIIVALALTLPRLWRSLIVGCAAAACIFLMAVKFDAIMGLARGPETSAAARRSANQRIGLAYVSWRMFSDQPWLGVHFGRFPAAKLAYLDNGPEWVDLEDVRYLSSHNTFLSLLTETGLLGLGLFLLLLSLWIRTAWRIWSQPRAPTYARSSAALLLASLAMYTAVWMFHELSFAPIDHGLLFLWAGIVVGLHSEVRGSTLRS